MDALREALTVQKEIMRRLPGEYCWTEAEAIARMQERVKDFTAEEFKKLDWEGRMDWRFVEGRSGIRPGSPRRCWLPTPTSPPGS